MKIFILISLLFLIACKDQVSDNSLPSQRPVLACDSNDNQAPVLVGTLSIANDATKRTSPTISWQAGSDNCDIAHYEIKIGTTLEGDDVLGLTNIGRVMSYQQHHLNLEYRVNYFVSLRAVDGSGNTSAFIHSSPWKIYSPQKYGSLIVWLDASDFESIEDSSSRNPGEAGFNNMVSVWKDISETGALHHFTASSSRRPTWTNNPSIRFNGGGQFLATADHSDINLGTSQEKTVTIAFKTGGDINSTQILYEEGGTVRGLNLYISSGKFYCGFWNDRNDGDGKQPFISSSGSISGNTHYIATIELDYSNYTGPNGVDGTVDCILDGVSLGQVATTSRLFPHSGDIGLGAVNNHTVLHSGTSSSSKDHYFQGEIFEFIYFNKVNTTQELDELHTFLEQKWRE
jgi:hypothetical protein